MERPETDDVLPPICTGTEAGEPARAKRKMKLNRYPGIKKMPNGRYRAMHHVGRSQEVRTFDYEEDAREWKELKDRQVERGELGPSLSMLKKFTLRMALEKYIQYDLKPGDLPTDTTPEGRRQRNRITNDIYALRAFKNERICDTSIADWNVNGVLILDKYVELRSARQNSEFYEEPRTIETLGLRPDKGALYRTIDRQFARLRVVFPIIAKKYYPGLKNHFKGYKVAREGTPSLHARFRPLKDGELTKIETICEKYCNDGTLDETLTVIYLAIETGMRRGEIFDMQWKHVNEDRTLHIPIAKRGPRTICLSFLAQYVIEREFGKREETYIIPRKGRKDTALAFKYRWQKIIERDDGINDLQFRDLRKEARTRFYAAGLDTLQTEIMLGHKNHSISNTVYLPKGDPRVLGPITELLDKDLFGGPTDQPADRSYVYGRMLQKGYGTWMMKGLFSERDKELYHQAEAAKKKVRDPFKKYLDMIRKPPNVKMAVIHPDGLVERSEFEGK